GGDEAGADGAGDHLMPSRSRYLRIADSSTFLMGRLSSRAMSVSARAMMVGPYARSASMSMAALNSCWLVSWRWSRTMVSAPRLSRGVAARRFNGGPFGGGGVRG